MRRWDIRRISVGLVLGAEAAGAVLIHEEQLSAGLAIPLIVVVVAGTVWLLESGIDRAIKKWDRVASWFGARLGKGQKVHGWWYGRIYADSDRAGRPGELLAGSVFRIRADADAFTIEGEAYMLRQREWAEWEAGGTAYGDNEIVYRYQGIEENTADDGYGVYAFHGDPPDRLDGGFFGNDLWEHKHRLERGDRCPPDDVKGFGDQARRRECLLKHLAAHADRDEPQPQRDATAA